MGNNGVTSIRSDSSHPAILYLVHRIPYPPNKGDRIRAFHLLKSLSQKATIHLACLADEPLSDDLIGTLRRYCERVAVISIGSWSRWARALGSLARGKTVTEGAFRSPQLSAVVREWARDTNYQACLASASSMVPYLEMEELRGVPAVVDLVDVDSQKWLDYAAASRGPRAWLYRTEGRRLRRLEHELLSWVRAVTLVSEAEANLYRRCCADGQVHAVVNGVDLEYFQPARTSEQGCVFVGQLDYRPNVEGIDWFCHEVWPTIHRFRPNATLSLVGRRPVPAVQRLAAIPGVDLIGEVVDIRPHLNGAAVALVPLRIARGIQNKVLEALAMAKAVVGSPQAIEGLGTKPDSHLLAASSPEEWVKAVIQLLDDPDLRRRLGRAGRQYVETHHQWDRCLEPFGPILGLPKSNRGREALPVARSHLVPT